MIELLSGFNYAIFINLVNQVINFYLVKIILTLCIILQLSIFKRFKGCYF